MMLWLDLGASPQPSCAAGPTTAVFSLSTRTADRLPERGQGGGARRRTGADPSATHRRGQAGSSSGSNFARKRFASAMKPRNASRGARSTTSARSSSHSVRTSNGATDFCEWNSKSRSSGWRNGLRVQDLGALVTGSFRSGMPACRWWRQGSRRFRTRGPRVRSRHARRRGACSLGPSGPAYPMVDAGELHRAPPPPRSAEFAGGGESVAEPTGRRPALDLQS